MTINLPQLRAFIAVIDCGGFSAAAANLGVTQSAVSHAVAGLERTLGGPVLTRHVPPRPNAFGERITEHARSAIAAVAAIRELAGDRDGLPTGRVRLAAPPTVCHGLLPGLLERWRDEFPTLEVTTFAGDDEEVGVWLASDVVDMAVVVGASQRPALTVGMDSFQALLRKDHPLAEETALDVAELDDDAFLLSVGGCERFIHEIYRSARVPLAPAHRVRDLATLLAMVRSGIGVSIVPGLAETMIDTNLTLVPLRETVTRTLALTGPSNRSWHPTVAALVAATATTRVPTPTTHHAGRGNGRSSARNSSIASATCRGRSS